MNTRRKSLKGSPPPPAVSKPKLPLNHQGPTLGSVLREGIALGTGSAIGHRAVDVMMGPRQIKISQPSKNITENDICKSVLEKYDMCLKHNISSCNELNDLLIQYKCK